jgi:low affinity Fe/Cu permease
MAPKAKKNITEMDAMAAKFTGFIGSPASIIIHTIAFVASFALVGLGVKFETVLLILTTAVSLEAIYLALFIQMTVNKNTASLAEVEEDIDEIQEDVEGIEKDIDEIEKDIDEIQEDVEEIEKDDVEDDLHDAATMDSLSKLQLDIQRLMEDIQSMKDQKK